jgi:hypothetical protein
MDHQTTISPEITFHHPPADDTKKRIIKTTIVLSVITMIELAMGFSIYFIHKNPDFSHGLVLGIKGCIVILSMAKAFYIVSVFMHLGDEIRNMIMTIIVPLMLFIWFISAFLWDGNSYKNLRNKYDKHFQERTAEDKKSTH